MVRSAGLLFGAAVVRNVGLLLLLLFFARVFDQATVGYYTLALAIATPLFGFAQLGLRTVYVTLRPNAPIKDYALVQGVSLTLAFVVLAAIAVVVGTVGLEPSVPGAFVLTLLLVGVAKMADMFADTLTGPLQLTDRIPRVFGAAVATVVVTVGVAATIMFATRSLNLALAGLAVSAVLATFVVMYLPVRKVGVSTGLWSEGSATRRTIVMAGLPSGVTVAAIALVSTMPQYFLTPWHGPAVAAHFAVLLYLYALADLATGAAAQAWIPTARRRLVDGALRSELVRTILRWTAVYIPGTAVGMVLAAWALPVVFPKDYTLGLAQAVPLGLAIVALPFAFFSMISVSVLNRYAHGLTLSISSTLVALVLCAVLIGPLGMTGAAWALVGAVLTRGVVAFIIVMVDKSHVSAESAT
ncbi:MAG: hypothetical protein FWD18_03805 [Micrococcales bacterium]|nr:hypothetical protein [Micrococcales bacterium]